MRFVNVMAVALLAVMLPAVATAKKPEVIGVIGDDDRRILGEEDPRWDAVGRLNREAGGFCTATLIAPNEVLTAAHCLWDSRRHRWLFPDTIHFVPGYRRGDYEGHAIGKAIRRADTIEFTKEGRPIKITDDWAIVELDRDLQSLEGIAPLPIAGPQHRAELGEDSGLARAGYGQDRPHLPVIVDPCAVLGLTEDQQILLHDCDATFGESGSPIMLKTGDDYVVLGVQSAVITRDDLTAGAAVMLGRIIPQKVLE